jgi:hypothetical protein
MTGRGAHEVSPGTQRALNPNVLILIALGIGRVFLLDQALNLHPKRGAFIEKCFH